MSRTFQKLSGERITHACWKSSGKLIQGMYSGASHVLVMRDGERLMICFVRFSDEGMTLTETIKQYCNGK
jgi:hypothetical protein